MTLEVQAQARTEAQARTHVQVWLQNTALPREIEASTVGIHPFATRGRGAVERFVSGVFRISYGARLREFMPLLISLHKDGQFDAALGLRSARDKTLFCEKYLDHPVEDFVRERFGENCSRRQIMEMGNLVGTHPGQASLLYTLVGAAMYEAGVDYLLFAANRAVRLSLKRGGFKPVALAPAERNRLGAAGTDWGSYYNGRPQVMLGDVQAAMKCCMHKPATRRILSVHSEAVDELASVIKSHRA